MAMLRMTSDEIRKRQSKTDWSRVKALGDTDIDFSDLPEATDKQLASGTSDRAANLGRPKLKDGDRKIGTYIRFSRRVLNHLRASGKNWQTRLSKKVEELVDAGEL